MTAVKTVLGARSPLIRSLTAVSVALVVDGGDTRAASDVGTLASDDDWSPDDWGASGRTLGSDDVDGAVAGRDASLGCTVFAGLGASAGCIAAGLSAGVGGGTRFGRWTGLGAASTGALLLAECQRAAASGADLVVAPELALWGYPARDLLLRPSLRQLQ